MNPAFCQEDPRIDLVCEFEDYYDFEAFKYVDTLLYVANRYGLFIYSFNENNMEAPPVELVRYPTCGDAESLLIVDTLCYLADSYAGLRILDISDIYNIQEIGYCEDAANGQFLQLQDGVLYMACGRSYFRSVDVNDPANPILLQTLRRCSDDFRIHDNLAYSVSDDNECLDIFDISNPSDIQIAEQVEFDFMENGQGVEIHDDYLYFVSDEKFRILSIANPDSLEILYEGEYGRSVANTIRYFSEDLLYMGCYRIWDVSDPREPEMIFGDWLGRSSDWSEVGERVSFSCNGIGFYIYNIENLERVEEIHWLPVAKGLSDVYVQDDLMYVTSKEKYGSKFDIYNIEDICTPIKVGEIDSTEGAGAATWGFDGICVPNDLAILWAWFIRDAILIYSVEDPRQPIQIGEYRSISPVDVVVDGDYIYAACDGRDGFKVISIANPRNPELVWEYLPPWDYPFDFYGVAVAGEFAYTINMARDGELSRNFRVWDRSNPDSLQLMGSCEVRNYWGKVEVRDEYALISGEGDRILSVVSIDDPENPELIHTQRLPDFSCDVTIENDYLCITYYNMGFSLYNLEDPAEPELVTWFDTPSSRGMLYVVDSYVFLSGLIYDVAKVTGRWNVELSTEAHDFGVVHLNTDSTFQLMISNLARQDVEILDISCDSAAFMVDFNEAFAIAAGEDASVNITFTPTEERLYDGQLIIHTERHDLTVQLSGTGANLGVNDGNLIPIEFALHDAYPNPFNTETIIRYSMPVRTDVSLIIFDLYGRRVKTLIDAPQIAGYHTTIWDGRNEAGIPVSSGLYFYRINAGNFTKFRKMTMVR